MTQVGRMAVAVMMSFCTAMLLGATLAWSAQQLTGPLAPDILESVVWVLFAITFFGWVFTLDWLQDGDTLRAARGAVTNTVAAALAIVIVYVIWNRALPFHSV